jgi:tetratricopeptide (TPR) repeat protein
MRFFKKIGNRKIITVGSIVGICFLLTTCKIFRIEVFINDTIEQVQTAEHFLDRGIRFASKGEYQKAIADFTEALKLDQEMSKAYLLRGRAYCAIASNVIVIDKKFERVHVLSNAGRQLKKEEQRAYEQAITDFTETIRLDENNVVAYLDRGVTYAQKGDYDKAIADFTEAIRLDPNFAVAYNDRGCAYDEKKDHDKAITDYTEAIRLNPNYALAYYNRGCAYHDKKDYDKAITDYTEAVRLDPNDLGYKQNLENALRQQGR